MWRAFTLSIDQLSDRAILSVLVKSLAVTLVVLAAIGWAGYGLMLHYATALTDWLNAGADGATIASIMASLMVAIMLLLLFRAIAVAVLNFFADEVVAAVERKHYPQAASGALKVSFGTSMRLALMSGLRVIGINLLLLPVYLFFFVIGIGPIIFLAVNALLFGRDLGEMVAVRHVRGDALKAWLANSRIDRGILGIGVTCLFMIPLVNLIVPLIGAAMATHIFHGQRGR